MRLAAIAPRRADGVSDFLTVLLAIREWRRGDVVGIITRTVFSWPAQAKKPFQDKGFVTDVVVSGAVRTLATWKRPCVRIFYIGSHRVSP